MLALVLAAQSYTLADSIAPVPANCANTTINATLRNPVSPTYPDSAGNLERAAHVVIRVTVNDDGSVGALQVVMSSGNEALDNAAMSAARASTYTSAFVNCVPVSGGYYPYRAEFNGPAKAAYAIAESPPCPNPVQDASTIKSAAPVYPASARALGLDIVSVVVEVTVSPHGTATAAKLLRSTGNPAIDQAALRAALDSTYAPRLVNCLPVTGEAMTRIDFDPRAPAPSASP
jgi:TonB family protein